MFHIALSFSSHSVLSSLPDILQAFIVGDAKIAHFTFKVRLAVVMCFFFTLFFLPFLSCAYFA